MTPHCLRDNRLLSAPRLRATRAVRLTIALSCKGRPPCRPHCGTVAAATNLEFGASDVRLPCRRAVGAAPGGPAAEPRLGGLCQLVRIVGRRQELRRVPEKWRAPQRFSQAD